MSKKKLTEEAVVDMAAGQRAFIEQNLPMPPDEDQSTEALKMRMIRISVELYINDAESTKKQLLEKIKAEEMKNRTAKHYAELLAREMLMHFPGHGLAEEALALLLEDKMSSLHLTSAVTANGPPPLRLNKKP